MRCVARRISDAQVLALIKMWLKTPIEETDGRGRKRLTGGKGSRMGTPQGGVISPLLANIYMNRFLKYWRQNGLGERLQAHVVAYADDLVILSRGCARQAYEVLRTVTTRMGLTLNEDKTRLKAAGTERFDFLGYSFGPYRNPKLGRWYLGAGPSPNSCKRLRGKVRTVLAAGIVAPWPDVRDRLNRLLRGWQGYFSYGAVAGAYGAANWYVADRVRHFLCRRHKVPTRGTREYGMGQVFGAFGVVQLRRRPQAAGAPHAFV